MTDDLKKVSTPRGDARSMTALYPTNVSVNFRESGPDWMGPLSPITPIAPPEVAGRAWDYVPGYNLATQPRTFEPVNFHQLRALADSYDPVRLIIERRKDQMCRLPWTIRMKHEGSKRPKAAQLSAATRERIADIEAMFKRPSYGETFKTWLRSLLDDHFVIDAPSIYLKRNWRGDLTGLQVIDGALIKPVISDDGRRPEPREWSGEPFDWNGLTITRQNFTEQGCKYLNGFAWPPIAQQILKGLPAANLTALDLLYKPANVRPGHAYGLSPCEQIMTTVAIATRRANSQLEYFREGNQPDAIYSLPATWQPDQVQRFQDYWDSMFSGNLGNRRRMKFLAGDGKYTELHEPPLKNEFDEWLVRIICFAFSYPVTAFVKLQNRATAEQHDKTGEEEGLQNTKQWAADLCNCIIEDHLGEEDMEFAFVEEDEIDQGKQSEILTRYAEDGVLTLNQVREKLGEEPDPDPAANRLMVKTATGYVPVGAHLGDAANTKENT